MEEKLIIAGAGGQGIMLMGKVLAEAAMRENKFVTWLPAYGAEVRGGTAHCMVVISDQEIGSPYIGQADSLIIMNQPSLEKFLARLKAKGLLIINSSLVNGEGTKQIPGLKYPFTEQAINLGNIKVANMVALGSYLVQTKVVGIDTVRKTIAGYAPQDKKNLIEINQKAITYGERLAYGKS